MKRKAHSFAIALILSFVGLMTLVAGAHAIAQETVLYNFTGGSDAKQPYAGLIFDSAGNLYGTTPDGGAGGFVFELTPGAGGVWTQIILHSFTVNGVDGYSPFGSLVFDSAGTLYGTTYMGGAYNAGTIFEMRPSAGGVWTERVLHSFNNNGVDGTYPNAGLILDAAGNLYGTTPTGGADNGGTVFELTHKTAASWTERVLHSFPNPNNEFGAGPDYAKLTLDASGNLYGTTQGGGTYNFGTVFELVPHAGGLWSVKILHSFNDNGDGWSPQAGVILDSSRNLYGTTSGGGVGFDGRVFELSPAAGGSWTEKSLHDFTGGDIAGGATPIGTLVFDASGNLYGTTYQGGNYGGGAVYELSPGTGGTWTENVMHSFGSGTDGLSPWAGVVLDNAGNVYGTTLYGGADGAGTVYEVTP